MVMKLEGKGKPDPAPFKVALQRLNLDNNESLVVENAPLGIKSGTTMQAFSLLLH